MLDNHSDHIFEKAFVHNSWKDLQQKLDAELPTQKDSKKPWVLGLCALQFIALTVVTGLWLNSKQDISYAQATKEKVIVETIVVKEEVPAKQVFINNNHTKPLDYKRTSFADNTDYPSITYIFSALPSVTETSLKDDKQNLNIINKLPSINSLYSQPKLEMDFAKEENETQNFSAKQLFKNSLTFGIGFTSLATYDLDFTGYGFVSSLQYSFNNKFGLSTGLGFNRISREFMFVPMLVNNTSHYNVSPKEIKLDRAKTFYRSLSDMKQIYVPFIANYNVTDNLALLTGVKLRYTFDSNIDNTLTSALVQKTSASVVDPQDIYYNRANVGLAVGFSFSPNKHFSLDVDTEFGLGSLLNNSQFEGLNVPTYNLNLLNVTTSYKF